MEKKGKEKQMRIDMNWIETENKIERYEVIEVDQR